VTPEELLVRSGLPRGNGQDATSAAGVRKVYLHAGQLYATADAAEIVTILGSCVSVCLFDAARGVGGINHFMLPNEGPANSPRYAASAVDLLIEQLLALGAGRSRLQAKLFGGASVLKPGGEKSGDLGARNVESARVKLAREQIAVVSEDVGGVRGRKLVFFTQDGTAFVKQV
jgi:chemotaxis protein CheD